MKILHCADLHLESKINGISPEKSRIRREETLLTFERMCDYAQNNGVTAVIIAGDMFDTEKVSLKAQARILGAISDKSDVDFLYLCGNHDEESFILKSENLPKNIKIFTDKWTRFTYGNVTISGVQVNELNSGVVYDQLKLDPETFNVVVMHGQTVSYASDDAQLVSIPSLKNKNIDYLALGHIHSYLEGEIDERGKYVYSGCLEGRGFDECGDKGFVLIDVKGCNAEYEFIKFSYRNLYEFEYDISLDANWIVSRNKIIEELKKTFSSNSLVKVVLKGEHSADFGIDIDGLNIRLQEEFFFAKVYDKTTLKINIEDYALDKSVRGEFVRSVWESTLSEQEKMRVIMCGINALKGEEI